MGAEHGLHINFISVRARDMATEIKNGEKLRTAQISTEATMPGIIRRDRRSTIKWIRN